jgi:protein involved in polysaccharide export with SLBB domain
LHATGTIVTVEEQAHDEQSYDLLPGPRVCFKIDSFAEVPSAKRNVCESAERARQAAHGPRCRDTSIDPSAVKLNPGDRVDVYFTSQDSGQISIARVSASGIDL